MTNVRFFRFIYKHSSSCSKSLVDGFQTDSSSECGTGAIYYGISGYVISSKGRRYIDSKLYWPRANGESTNVT